ncbi:MAG: hypothetical protein K8S99_12775 [Planctomycetes bacterium]|nr:hypothetical protein [Planctomycetota bacterium]
MKPYRVLYNQDCTNLFGITKEPITPAHVDRMVDEVADGGADAMLINPNAQRVCYPSRVWQTFWDGYTPGDNTFFGPVLESEFANRARFVQSMKSLADQGCDYLARALARCRHKGIAPGVTVRMNDMHDAPTPGTHLFSRFYMEHPELWLDNGVFPGWSARGLNYAFKPVRDYYLTLIRELVMEYDTEVLELDFLRFHCYFPRSTGAAHTATMSGFLREVRTLLAAAKRPITLTARVPVTPASAVELGLDVAQWAREGLVDAITPGAFLTTHWCIPVDEYKKIVGTRVAVYACSDYIADRRPGLPRRTFSNNPIFIRGFAAGNLAAGADGIEVFNFFCSREEAWGPDLCEPAFAALGESRNLDALRGVTKTYTLACGCSQAETDGPFHVPALFYYGTMRSFEMLLAAEAESVQIEVDVVFTGGPATADQFWLHVNRLSLGQARSVTPLPDAPAGRRATWALPAKAILEGRNLFMVRNENDGDALTVVSIDVRVI